MYTLYDLYIDRKVIATLAYISLDAGITFKNKVQFDNILYKLYKYLENDINFNEGIVITDEIKNKIRNFKNIHLEIADPEGFEASEEYFGTFPKYAYNVTDSPVLDIEYITKEEIEAAGEDGLKLPYKFWCDPKNSSDYCSVQAELVNKSTGSIYKQAPYTSKQILSNLDYWELYVGLNAAKTAYTVTRHSYNINGELIKKETLTYSTSYPPSTNDFKPIKVYGDYVPTECHKVIEGFSIDDKNLTNIDETKLKTGDKYFANDFHEYSNKNKTIAHYSLTGKTINNIKKDMDFEEVNFIASNTIISQENNSAADFVTILKNENTNEQYAFLSSYPLYYTEISGEDGLWNIYTGVKAYFKALYSADGLGWAEYSDKITNASKDGTFFYVQSSPAYISGFKIFYSNYPIYYSYYDYATILKLSEELNYTIEETELYLDDCNNEISLLNIQPRLANNSSLVQFKNSDVDFPLKRLTLGAELKFGSHKIENSSKFQLLWRPLDYTDKLKFKSDTERYPQNSVLLQTTFAIDALPLGTSNSLAYTQYDLLPFQRWANSEEGEGEWWSPVYEGERAPNETYAVKNGQYSHRAGFLNSWSLQEKNLLKPISIDNYSNQKILNLHGNDSPYMLTHYYRPRLFNSFGSSATFIDNPYFAKNIKYHLNYQDKQLEELDNYICNLKTGGAYWRRQRESNNTTKYGYKAGASTTEGYNIYPIVPICCLDGDLIVKKEPDIDGKYMLDLPFENIEFEGKYEVARDIVENINIKYDTKINVVENKEFYFDTNRALGVRDISLYDTERNIRKNTINTFNIVRAINSPIEKIYPTIREVNYFYNFRFPTVLKTIRNTEVEYPTIRDVIEEFFIVEKFNTERLVTKNTTKIFDTERNVLGLVNKNYQTMRFIQENIEAVFDTILEVITYREFNYPLQRDIQNNIDILYPTRLKATNNIELLFDIERSIYKKDIFNFDIERKIQNNISSHFETKRFMQSKCELNYELLRYISEPTISKFNIERYITNEAINKFTVQRTIKKEQAVSLTFDIIRDVLENTEFISKSTRYIQENYSDCSEVCRNIIEDFLIINENLLREVNVNMEVKYPTKRAVTSTANKYVSKDNLMLYTVLLKQEIATFIEQKINHELEKRGL